MSSRVTSSKKVYFAKNIIFFNDVIADQILTHTSMCVFVIDDRKACLEVMTILLRKMASKPHLA